MPPKSRRFSLLVGYNIYSSSSSTNQNAALIIGHKLDFTNASYAMLSKYGQFTGQFKTRSEPKFCGGRNGAPKKIVLIITTLENAISSEGQRGAEHDR